VDLEEVGTFHELPGVDGIQQESCAYPLVGIPSSCVVPSSGAVVDDVVVVVLLEWNASCDEVEQVLLFPWETELVDDDRKMDEEVLFGRSLAHPVVCPSMLHRQLASRSRRLVDP